jgi:bifunctional DNA-binding transcriptional regulator/antitoxin component of YhaV-PrlF toxin-antitoxin module
MSIATISPGGQLAIPPEFQRALHLGEGGTVMLTLEEGRMIVQPGPAAGAVLEQGGFGRPVLKAAPGAPPMTPEQIKAILDESP